MEKEETEEHNFNQYTWISEGKRSKRYEKSTQKKEEDNERKSYDCEEDRIDTAEERHTEKEMKDNVGDSDPESFQSFEEVQVFKKCLRQEGAPNDYILVKFETEKPVF